MRQWSQSCLHTLKNPQQLEQRCPDKNLCGFQLTGDWTVVWRNENFWGKRAPYAESSFIILTYYGLIYLWRSYELVLVLVLSIFAHSLLLMQSEKIVIVVETADSRYLEF